MSAEMSLKFYLEGLYFLKIVLIVEKINFFRLSKILPIYLLLLILYIGRPTLHLIPRRRRRGLNQVNMCYLPNELLARIKSKTVILKRLHKKTFNLCKQNVM